MSDDVDIVATVAGAEVLHFPQRKGRKKKIAVKRKVAAIGANDDALDPPEDNGGFSTDEMNEEWALVLIGSKSMVLRERSDAPIEDRKRFLSVDAFQTLHLNNWTERRQPDGKIKSVTHANAWLRSPRRRTYDGVEFHPDPNDVAGTDGYLNLWQGFSVEPERREGATYAVFKDHLLTNVANGDPALFNWIWGWCAHIVQRPRERIGTALVLRGKMGSGKTKVGEVIGSVIQAHYFLVDDPRYLVGQFNAHLASCLLLQADEGFWAGDKAAEGRLKGLVTAEYQMIEAKGVDPIRLRNFVRLMISSNEDWVIPAGKDERRFAVVDVGSRCARNHDYFREMDEQLAAGGRALLLADLLAFDLESVNLRVIPKTGALLEQKLRSLDHVESWWFERLMSGEIIKSAGNWDSVVSTDALFDDYCAVAQKIGIRRLAEKTSWGMKLRKLLPAIKLKRTSSHTLDGASHRAQAYEVPSLGEARSAFEIALGQRVDWSETTNETGEREPEGDFFEL